MNYKSEYGPAHSVAFTNEKRDTKIMFPEDVIIL